MSAKTADEPGPTVGQLLSRHFDHVYCVNLDHRNDRWNETLDHFGEFGLSGVVERYAGVNFKGPELEHLERFIQPEGKETRYSFLAKCGCIAAHRGVVADAEERGFERILVFEDDVKLLDVPARVWAGILEDLSAEDWDLFFLGATYTQPPARHSRNLLRLVENPNAYHACGYSRGYWRRMLEAIPEDTEDLIDEASSWEILGFDVWMRSESLTSDAVFGADPMLATQRKSDSDISNLHGWDIENFQLAQFEKMRPPVE